LEDFFIGLWGSNLPDSGAKLECLPIMGTSTFLYFIFSWYTYC